MTDWVSDGYAEYEGCDDPRCDLEVVRPGKVQCSGYCDEADCTGAYDCPAESHIFGCSRSGVRPV